MTARGAAFAAFRQRWSAVIERELDALLPPEDEAPARLHAAMRYALFPGGKRLRPLLCLMGCEVTGGLAERALTAAAGLECLHTYSLVHDDLPCMDDDALRRGRPTCHVRYGEATALLAGDALLTLAFAATATAGSAAVHRLAAAAGSRGMVGGQEADLDATFGRGQRSLDRVEWIHDRKTGALITASVLVGALAGCGAEDRDGAPPAGVLQRLERYGFCLGRAFQIADDCLDLTGSAEELGKNPNADTAQDKLTWPAVVGLEQSLKMARGLAAEAADLAGPLLREVAVWRPLDRPALDGAEALLQDVAFAAVERRS
ncbi:MAG: polyprenyl synthetase family protein [Planctomycetota bacterium]